MSTLMVSRADSDKNLGGGSGDTIFGIPNISSSKQLQANKQSI